MNPDLYHGRRKSENFFEGWYFKICDAKGEMAFAFIPGIAMGRNEKESHSFLQVLDGNRAEYRYIRFDKRSFIASEKKFHIKVGKSSFSNEHMKIEVEEDGFKIYGNVKIDRVKKWPDTIVNPGSMGFYNYLWFMECYSQVCVIYGEISGELNFNGERVNLNGSRIYIEKNWGRSFPKSWIWLQSNSFKERGISFTCSIGRVPFMYTSFSGFLVGLNLGDKFYSFTTINRSRMKIIKSGDDVELEFVRKNIILKVKSSSDSELFMTCLGPKNGEMIPLVDENLKGEVEIKLMNKKSGEIIYEGIGRNCGIEYGGEALYEREA